MFEVVRSCVKRVDCNMVSPDYPPHPQEFPESHIINPLLTKFVRSRWLEMGLIVFCELMDLVHKLTYKELGQHPAILTSHLVNNPYIRGFNSVIKPFLWHATCEWTAMPGESCYKVAVLLAVTLFYPAGLSCPGYLVTMLNVALRLLPKKCRNCNTYLFNITYNHLLKYTDQNLVWT